MPLPTHINDREYGKFHLTDKGEISVVVTSDVEILNGSGKVTEVTINDTTWTPLPATALAGRKTVAIQNQSNAEIKINYNPAQAGYVGMIIKKDGERVYNISDDVIIYAKAITGTIAIAVEEAK